MPPMYRCRPARLWWLASLAGLLLAGCGAPPLPADGRYRVEGRAPAVEAALAPLVLSVSWAALEPDALRVRVALTNTSDRGLTVTGPDLAGRATLQAERGGPLRPLEVSANLAALSPPEGFSPGAANVGELRFPRPRAGGPLTLRVPGFAPLAIVLGQPYRPPLALPAGRLALDVPLRTEADGLDVIELRARGLSVGPTVRLELAARNVTRSGWRLEGGPVGGEARLLDAEGTAYAPRAVSPSLAAGLGPVEGWRPGAETTGWLEFERPAVPGALRIVLPPYEALVVETDGQGLVARALPAFGHSITLARGVDREGELYAQLLDLLRRGGRALAAGDRAGWLAVAAPEAQGQLAQLAQRVAGLPLDSLSLEPDPKAALQPAADGWLHGVPVLVRYQLSGVPADNTFTGELRGDFAPAAGGWRVAALRAGAGAPFWALGPVEVHRSDHFLLLTRPQNERATRRLLAETETAYARLAAAGWPLEACYVGHVTATTAEFEQLAGRDEHTAGVAAWRYDVIDEQVTIYSRAFYLNGAALDRPGAAEERQTTIIHELVHLVLADDTRPLTPAWLTEGLAVEASGETTPEALSALVAHGLERVDLVALTRAERLGLPRSGLTTDRRQGRYEYDYSGAVVAWLEATYGIDALFGLLHAYREWPPGVAEPSADERQEVTAQLLASRLGLSLEQLDAAVKATLRGG